MKTFILEPFDWDKIKEEAKHYKYVVMYREGHYRGNGKGEFFESNILNELFEKQIFWFNNEYRPIQAVILTNDDVESIINKRKIIISKINIAESDYYKFKRDLKYPKLDRRTTRKTNPQDWANFDKIVNKKRRMELATLKKKRDLSKELDALPYYSTTLYHIRIPIS